MFYAYSPSTGFDTARAAALDGRPRASMDEDGNDTLVPRRAVTLDELAAEKRGLGGTKPRAGRRVFGDLSNANASSRLVRADAQRESAAPRSGGSTRSRATTACSDASTLRMEVTLTREELEAVQAHRRRNEAKNSNARAVASKPCSNPRDGSRRGHSHHESSPRTPSVESPRDSVCTEDTDDTVPPGALTLQRAGFDRGSREGRHSDFEATETHRGIRRARGSPNGSVARESDLTKLLLWREKGRTFLVFVCGGLCLVAARAPGFVAAHLPVNPVVLAAYLCMAYLCRANALAAMFPTRAHGLSVDPDAFAETAKRLARAVNALADSRADVLSGRSNAKVLKSFLSLYGIAKLGDRLNSTWWVFATVWCAAFSVPLVVEMKRDLVFSLRGCFEEELLGRWNRFSAERRWGSGIVVSFVSLYVADLESRIVLGFAGFVAARLWRETHLAQAARIDRAVRDASRRLSRAGSEFHALMRTPSQFFGKTRSGRFE